MDIIYFLEKRSMNFRKFSFSEENIFYDWIYKNQSNLHDFSNNWQYIIQATRNFHGVVENEAGVVYFTKRWNKKSNYLVIVNYYGEGAMEIIRQMTLILSENSKYKIIVKNVTHKKEIELLKLGFRSFNSNESWINVEANQFWKNNPKIKRCFLENNFNESDFRYDDNTYPEYLFDIKELLGMQGKKYSGMRHKIRNFIRDYPQVKIKEYNPIEHKKEVINLLREWAIEMNNNFFEEYDEAIKAHEFCFMEELSDFSKIRKVRLIFQDTIKKEIVGFSYLTINKNLVMHNALFQKKGLKNFKKYMVVESLKYIQNRIDCAYVNFQGSETASLDLIKKDFIPCKVTQKKHMMWGS